MFIIFIINILEIDWDVATLKHTSDYVFEYKFYIQYNNFRYVSSVNMNYRRGITMHVTFCNSS